MKLTPYQLASIRAILNDFPKDNIKSISNEDAGSSIIVEAVTRTHVTKMDQLLGTRGISIVPNDGNTLKIIL